MRFWGIPTLLLLAACSNASVAEPLTERTDASSIIDTESGRYRVELDSNVDVKTLPTNSDLKMLDGDIAQYAAKLCGLDFVNKLRPDRCEVFVQFDKTELITGYIALQQGADVRVETALETDHRRSGLGCFLSGALVNSDFESSDSSIDISKKFQARLPFFGWEKSPGNWMISTESSDENSAGGMWYIQRLNNKLRLSQERWNYCYRDSNIYIDEVFFHIATLTRSTA